MGRRKNDRPVSEPDESVLPDTAGNDGDPGDDDDVEASDMPDPGEWTVLQTGESAADAIAAYVFEEPWTRTQAGRDGKRVPTLAVEIKEREGGRAQGREVTAFSHSSKKDGPDLADRLDEFFTDRFQAGEPEPVRYIWAVCRNPLPELRDYDSRKTFHVVNRVWIARQQGPMFPSQVGTSGLPVPAGHPSGLAPVSIFNGPSPLGLDPARFTPPPFVPTTAAGIHGDIGGTGMRDLVGAVTDAFSRMEAVMERQQLFYADLCARQAQATMAMTEQVGRVLLRHPDAEMERYRLEHEYRMRQYEGQGEIELEKRREVGGIVRDLGGRLLENPGLTATLLGVARKMGVSKEDVLAAMGGDDE